MLQGMCCISLEITEHVGFEHMVPNVIGGEKVKTWTQGLWNTMPAL